MPHIVKEITSTSPEKKYWEENLNLSFWKLAWLAEVLDIQCRDLRGAQRVQKPLEDVKEKWAIKCCSQNLCDQKVNFCGDCRVPSSSGPTLSSSFFSTFSPRSSSAVSFWSLINIFLLRHQFVMLIPCRWGFAKATLPWKAESILSGDLYAVVGDYFPFYETFHLFETLQCGYVSPRQ